ncbi:MAG TPA: SDR family oxidoreductase [Kiritimatiellia bacterium]|nr:SDR family oxidoreductase [Kiritimatiellia bacterium]
MQQTDPKYAVLVTGASGGIGAASARALHRHGTRVILSGRSEQALAALAEELETTYFVSDVTVPTEVEQLIASSQSVHGRLDGIVHAVGSMLLKPAHITSPEEFITTINVNLVSAFLVLKYGVKPMMSTGGSMVFFSTVATGIGLANHEAIAAAKAGIEGMVRSAAASYASKGIRVNAVAPGLTRTPLAEKITSNEASLKASIALHPLGRIGEASDIASAVAWLMNPANTWITGQIIRVDGGLSTVRAR